MQHLRTIYAIVNVAALQERFKKGATVDTTSLVEAGLIRNFKNPIKILGEGELNIALNVTADKVSASAQKKIEDAGGSVTLIEKKKWKRTYAPKTKMKKEKPAKESTPEETDETPPEIKVAEDTPENSEVEEATEVTAEDETTEASAEEESSDSEASKEVADAEATDTDQEETKE